MTDKEPMFRQLRVYLDLLNEKDAQLDSLFAQVTKLRNAITECVFAVRCNAPKEADKILVDALRGTMGAWRKTRFLRTIPGGLRQPPQSDTPPPPAIGGSGN